MDRRIEISEALPIPALQPGDLGFQMAFQIVK
jgi:hypothetical protein